MAHLHEKQIKPYQPVNKYNSTKRIKILFIWFFFESTNKYKLCKFLTQCCIP